MSGLKSNSYDAWKMWFQMHGKNVEWSDEKQLMIDAALLTDVLRKGQAMKYVISMSLLLLLVSPARSESASMKSLPKSEDIFTIAINPIPRFPTPAHPEMDSNQLLEMQSFTPESLRDALPKFRPGQPEIKAGARRIWESGVIVLNDKKVLFWTTCRKNFIQVLTRNGPVSFIIGDGKDDL